MNHIHFNLLSIVQIISIVQGFVFGFIFIKEYKKTLHLFYFGLMFLTISLDFFPDLLENIGLTKEYPSLLLFPFDFTWLSTILLYIYLQKIPEIENKNINYTSLYLAIFFTLLDFVLFFLPIDLKIKISTSNLYLLYGFSAFIFSFIFIILSLKFVIKIKKEIGDNFSSFEFTEFRWAYFFVIILASSLFSTIAFLIILMFFEIYTNSNQELSTLLFAIMDLMFQYILIIYGLKHKYFQNLYREFSSKRKKNSSENSFEKNELENIVSSLDHYVTETKSYTKSNFSLTDASVAINIHPKKVSTALNSIKSQNFNTYINQFRVEHAKKLLEENASLDYTIEGIGNLVGFNSKSVFYREFKRNTGKTPSKYMEDFQ